MSDPCQPLKGHMNLKNLRIAEGTLIQCRRNLEPRGTQGVHGGPPRRFLLYLLRWKLAHYGRGLRESFHKTDEAENRLFISASNSRKASWRDGEHQDWSPASAPCSMQEIRGGEVVRRWVRSHRGCEEF